MPTRSYHDLSMVTDSAYKLAHLINTGQYHNIFYYEFHQEVDPKTIINCEQGLEAFIERAGDFNSIFISYYNVDEVPAKINVALKLGEEWFIVPNCGSNYYLGYGPTGILKLREACFKRNVAAFLAFDNFEQWVNKRVGSPINSKLKSDFTFKQKEGKRFERVIKEIRFILNEMEKQPFNYVGLSEEKLRDIIKTHVSRTESGRITAETKNVLGKTDIHISTQDGLNEFIFELKVWKGESTLLNATNQLMQYLRWKNNYAGIIVFSYVMNFNQILNKVWRELQENYNGVRISESEFKITLKHKSDRAKSIEVHVILANLKH